MISNEEQLSKFHPTMRGMHPDVLSLKKNIVHKCHKCKGIGHIDQVPCSCSQEVVSICGLDKAGVPREYWHYDLESSPIIAHRKVVEEAVKLYSSSFDNWRSCNFIMFGHYRVGKTTLAICAMKEFLKLNGFVSACYVTAREIVQITRQNDSGYKDIEYLSGVDFLIIDEIGKEADHQWQTKAFSHAVDVIIRKRRGSRTTIAITNFSKKRLAEVYDDNLMIMFNNDFIELSFVGMDKLGITA